MSTVVTQKIHKFQHWIKRRNPQYIALRMRALLERYGITVEKARQRTLDCVHLLARYNCSPTFPTPGRVVGQNGAFSRELHRLGAELAVHGYDHVDFHSLGNEEATLQFVRAVRAYEQSGIPYAGFRCPYLSYSDRLLSVIPEGMFKYSSNKAIWWDVISPEVSSEATTIFDSLRGFYQPASADEVVATPHFAGNVVEIPASLPDDLQLYDGLKVGEEGLAETWLEILHRTYERGEMFVLLFHPESFQFCALAFDRILNEARQRQPQVWVATLRDISDWWWEKSLFAAHVTDAEDGLAIRFDCTERATVLLRNVESDAPTHPWSGDYRVLEGRTCQIAATPRPFIGLLPDVPTETGVFLQEQGYIIETSKHATECGICLDGATVAGLRTQLALIRHIEESPAPLVRFWRWPNEYQSALSITGDLDALSLLDYASRVLPW